MMLFRSKNSISLILLCGILTACGGGGGGSSSSGSNNTNDGGDTGGSGGGDNTTGYFIDSAVSGLTYYTSTSDGTQIEGVTGPNGEYPIYSGQSITFAIGKLKLGNIDAQSTTTPYSFVSSDSSEALPLNIARLLQTLDGDQNPDNGIAISAEVRAAYTDTTKTFSDDYFNQDNFEFWAEDDMQYLLKDPSLMLVDEASALEHLQLSMGDINYSISLPGTRWHTDLYPIEQRYLDKQSETWVHRQTCTDQNYSLYRTDEYDSSRVTTVHLDDFQWVPNCEVLGDAISESPRDYDALTLCGQKLGDDPNANLSQCSFADLNSIKTYVSNGVTVTVHSAHAMYSGVVYRTVYKEYDDGGYTFREKWQSVTTQLLED